MTAVEKFSSGKRSRNSILALPRLQLPVAAFPDGVLPITLLTSPVIIRIQNVTPEFPADSVIQLYKVASDGTQTPIGSARTISDTESTDPYFIFELSIPIAMFPAPKTTEEWTLEYSVFDPFSGGGPVSGSPVRVIFDQESPGGADADSMPILEFTEDQLSGITQADIVGRDRIDVLLPAWYGSAMGDKVKLWLGASDALADGTYLANEYTVTSPDEGLVVSFLVSDMEALGNIRQYFAFQLTDKAGNISPRSNTVAIDVLLSDSPANLLAPVVPDYLDHDVITQEDAAQGVEVEIPQFDNPEINDRIYVIWGATRMPPYSIKATDPWDDNTIEPLATIILPYASVISEGSGNDKAVEYEVWRGNLLANTSPSTKVDVNLDTPGPGPDPDPDTPEHENLIAPTLKSAGGADNTIPPVDYGKDATATIPYLGVDGLQIWKPGDRVTVHWGTEDVAPPTPVTVANQATDILVTVPGLIMTVVGTIALSYTVSRDIAPSPNVGEALSPSRDILVQSAGLLPGDGQALQVAEFPEEDKALNVINRTTGGLDGTPLRIPLAGVSNVAVSDTITLRFIGRDSLTNPAAAEILPSEVVVTDHPITAQDLRLGYYQIDLPYNPILMAICRNGSTTDYSIKNSAGSTVALQKFVRVALDQPGNVGVCPVNP